MLQREKVTTGKSQRRPVDAGKTLALPFNVFVKISVLGALRSSAACSGQVISANLVSGASQPQQRVTLKRFIAPAFTTTLSGGRSKSCLLRDKLERVCTITIAMYSHAAIDPASVIARSNDAVRVTLKQPADSSKDVDFHPEFTYSIFGDEEIIFGYKNLDINLIFEAESLQAGLSISHSDKIECVGTTEADNIEDKLKDFLPSR